MTSHGNNKSIRIFLTGAEIEEDVIYLLFVDAERGEDILIQDSMVIDAGGPAFIPEGGRRGGCFISSVFK